MGSGKAAACRVPRSKNSGKMADLLYFQATVEIAAGKRQCFCTHCKLFGVISEVTALEGSVLGERGKEIKIKDPN